MAKRKTAGHLGSLNSQKDGDAGDTRGSRGFRDRPGSGSGSRSRSRFNSSSSGSSSFPSSLSSSRGTGQTGGLAGLKARRRALARERLADGSGPSESSGKLRILLIIGAVIVMLVAGYTIFTYLVPHTQVVVTTAYKDSWSGKFVQTEVNNKGTEPLRNLKISVAVWNGSQLMDSVQESVGDLKAHDNHTIQALHFYGNSLDQYTIVVQVSFKTASKNYQETFTHDSEPVQSHIWEDEIFQWN